MLLFQETQQTCNFQSSKTGPWSSVIHSGSQVKSKL